MLEYLKNLLPRLAGHSKTLDEIELFVDQPWVFLDEEAKKHQYIFLRDGKLLMSVNGKGFEGSWKYIPAARSLWIDNSQQKLLLNHGFVNEAVMLLRYDGSIDDVFALVNTNRLLPGDIRKYLESLLDQKKITTAPLTVGNDLYYTTVDEKSIIIVNGKGNLNLQGLNAILDGDKAATGFYILLNNLIIELKDGVVGCVYKHFRECRYKYNNEPGLVKIFSRQSNFFEAGDYAISSTKLPDNAYVWLPEIATSIIISNNEIVKKFDYNFIIAISIIILGFLITIIFIYILKL